MLISIVVLYVICWAPLTINNLLVAFEILPNINIGFLWYFRLTIYVLTYLNRYNILVKIKDFFFFFAIICNLSCANPILYSFMSKNFRKSFQLAFRKLFQKQANYDI
jgi:hypothetical protein